MLFLPTPSYFPHRCNSDGSIDSICPRCFITIGTSNWEADLERMETAHICNPDRLTDFDRWRKPRGKEPRGDRPLDDLAFEPAAIGSLTTIH